ncbi:response regulator [Snuella lapsa]|uniref:response regulator n=1 Tax=Snuella lapsa TaxID=870481 RepID=UPI0031EF252E
MIKKPHLNAILPFVTFCVFSISILFLWKLGIDNHNTHFKDEINQTGELISKEFRNIVNNDIARLKNLKNRIEFTEGAYYENWEKDATMLLSQSPSFKFVEWIDKDMIIKKITPLKGNEAAINLNISKLDYRRDEWIKHSLDSTLNFTNWLKLTQNGYSFLVDVPVYFKDAFQGTISAGMDFKNSFDRLVNYLDDQYAIELRDSNGTLFYETNKDIKLETTSNAAYNNSILVDKSDSQYWQLKVFPTKNLFLVSEETIINIALATGLLLSLLTSLLIYYSLRAKVKAKSALLYNSKLLQTNEALNKSRQVAEKASQAKTDFLSNMSHEIRTPLHAIIGFIQLLKSSNLKSEDKEYLHLMDKSSNNLLAIVNDILDVAKLESQNIQLEETVFNPLQTTKDLIENLQHLFSDKGLYITTRFNPLHGINAIGDKSKFIQIITHILKNAIKFTNQGGATIVYNELLLDNHLNIGITIQDTGIGIPKEKMATIFDRFTQVDDSLKKQHAGSGLGLAISKNLALMMGGNISVESVVDKGTKFHISIPLNIAENQTSVNTTDTAKESLNLPNLKILIVDDNNINVIVLKKLLEDLDIKVDTANNGEIAIEKVNSNTYQLVFMDIHMPVMDGCEATKHIRKTHKDLLIYGLSANVTPEATTKAIESGMNDYITKPFKKEQLYALLKANFDLNLSQN